MEIGQCYAKRECLVMYLGQDELVPEIKFFSSVFFYDKEVLCTNFIPMHNDWCNFEEQGFVQDGRGFPQSEVLAEDVKRWEDFCGEKTCFTMSIEQVHDYFTDLLRKGVLNVDDLPEGPLGNQTLRGKQLPNIYPVTKERMEEHNKTSELVKEWTI
jgi:hypothetical protein